MNKVLILASGGDAPGINDLIAFLLKGKDKDTEYYYAKYGLNGVYKDDIHKIDLLEVNNLFDMPSSIIKCGRLPEFETDENVRTKIANTIKNDFDRAIILGGNGTQKGAKILSEMGANITFVPLTIDNDVENTSATLGYYTSLEIIVNLINNASYSINAHGNIMLIEIMGRGCNDLIDNAFNLSNAHLKVLDDNKDPEELAKEAKAVHDKEGHAIILVREKLSHYTIDDYASAVATKGISTRTLVLGHLQRGGKTSIYDKLLAYEFAEAITESMDKKSLSIVKRHGKVIAVDINE